MACVKSGDKESRPWRRAAVSSGGSGPACVEAVSAVATGGGFVWIAKADGTPDRSSPPLRTPRTPVAGPSRLPGTGEEVIAPPSPGDSTVWFRERSHALDEAGKTKIENAARAFVASLRGRDPAAVRGLAVTVTGFANGQTYGPERSAQARGEKRAAAVRDQLTKALRTELARAGLSPLITATSRSGGRGPSAMARMRRRAEFVIEQVHEPASATAEPDAPSPPWYLTAGTLGDGVVSSVSPEADAFVREWAEAVTAGRPRATADLVRERVLALIRSRDPREWERALDSGELVVGAHDQVELTFSLADLRYEPDSEVTAEPESRTAFSTRYAEHHARQKETTRSFTANPLLFLAAVGQSALSHIGPALAISSGKKTKKNHGLVIDVQTANQVFTDTTHAFLGRIRARAKVNGTTADRPLTLLGDARLVVPKVFSSPAVDPDAQDLPVRNPGALQGLDFAVSAALTKTVRAGLRSGLESGLGLRRDAAERVAHAAGRFVNDRSLKDESQWWLTDSWVSDPFSVELPDRSEFHGHLEIGGRPRTVRYLTTTEKDVILRNDMGRTDRLHDGRAHGSNAGIAPSVGLYLPVGDYLVLPSAKVPELRVIRGYGNGLAGEGQSRSAIIRKAKLERYRTVFDMTVRVKSNKGDHTFTVPMSGELGVVAGHAADFRRLVIGGEPPSVPETTPAGKKPIEVVAPPAASPFPKRGVTGVADLLKLARRGPIEIGVPRALQLVAGDGRAREPRGHVPNPVAPRSVPEEPATSPLERLLRDAGLDPIADFTRDGGIAQIQLTEALSHRLASAGEDSGGALDRLRSTVAALRTVPGVEVLAADGRRLSERELRRPPEQRFVVGEHGAVHGPSRPWHHQVDPREPIALAARKGLGPGVAREMPGLEEVFRTLLDTLESHVRAAGAARELPRQFLAQSLALKFGVPGVRGAGQALLDGGASDEWTAADHVFSVALEAELRRLRREPVAEPNVKTEARRGRGTEWSVARETAIEAGGRASAHVRFGRFKPRLSWTLGAKGAWKSKVMSVSGIKRYVRVKPPGDVTRFEYETVYKLAVVTRRRGRPVAAQVRELSGDRYWTAVNVATAFVPTRPVPADDVLTYGDATTVPGPLDDESLQRLARRPGETTDRELDLSRRGLSGIQVDLANGRAVSRLLADLVTAHRGVAPASESADPFRDVLTTIMPMAADRLGVPERLLRVGTLPFLESMVPRMTGGRGLPIGLPRTADGWNQALDIRLRLFNPRTGELVKNLTTEQYTEATRSFGSGKAVKGTALASSEVAVFFPIGGGAVPGDEEVPTGGRASDQIGGGVAGGAKVSQEKGGSAQHGSLDLTMGIYTGNSQQVRLVAVYTVTLRRWRWKRNRRGGPRYRRIVAEDVRHLRIHDGAELHIPSARAADYGLVAPGPGHPGEWPERFFGDPDLAARSTYVEHVDTSGVLPKIHDLLGGDLDPDLLAVVDPAFSTDAVQAGFRTARRGGMLRVFASSASLWRDEAFWRRLGISPKTSGTVHTGIRITIRDKNISYRRPRPDVRVAIGGQAIRRTGKYRESERGLHLKGHLSGRWASAPGGLRPAVDAKLGYQYAERGQAGRARNKRTMWRGIATDTSQEFRHRFTYHIEITHRYSPGEWRRLAGRALGALPRMAEALSEGETRDWFRRLRDAEGPRPETGTAGGGGALLVPTHLTTLTAPSTPDVDPPGPIEEEEPTDEPAEIEPPEAVRPGASGPFAETLARHLKALAIPEPHRVPAQVFAALGDRPGATFEGTLMELALSEENVLANVGPLLAGAPGHDFTVRSPDGETLSVRLVLTNGRWLNYGRYTMSEAAEDAEESQRASEQASGWRREFAFGLGHEAGRPLHEGAARPLLDQQIGRDGESETSTTRKTSKTSQVENDPKRDEDVDYYVFDTEYLVTRKNGSVVPVVIPHGLKGMLPHAVARELATAHANLERPKPTGRHATGKRVNSWASDRRRDSGETRSVRWAGGDSADPARTTDDPQGPRRRRRPFSAPAVPSPLGDLGVRRTESPDPRTERSVPQAFLGAAPRQDPSTVRFAAPGASSEDAPVVRPGGDLLPAGHLIAVAGTDDGVVLLDRRTGGPGSVTGRRVATRPGALTTGRANATAEPDGMIWWSSSASHDQCVNVAVVFTAPDPAGGRRRGRLTPPRGRGSHGVPGSGG